MQPKIKNGMVQIYTGNGKGKTTAALGLALRAAGRDACTYIGQFLKGMHYGELDALSRFEGLITVEQFGRDGFIHVKGPTDKDIEMARAGLEKVRSALTSGDYDIVVADEIFVAMHFKLLTIEEVLELIDIRPECVELVMTGRKAPQELIERADLVTEMREIKHPYQKGINARECIEC